jgi:hypothetical protein
MQNGLKVDPYGKMVNISPFSVEGDKFFSPKGGEKFSHFVKKR